MTGESILVVEDDAFIALQIQDLLEKNGYRVSATVAYGEDAVAAVEKDCPALICMDIGLMGEMDGIDTARKIHERIDVPIIYLTSYSDSQRIARAKETGPYSYLIKPFNDRELLVSVDIALHRHKTERDLREAHRKLHLLSSITRHDILNQLSVLYGFLELSRREAAGSRMGIYVEKEIAATEAIRHLISFTRDYEEIGLQQPGWHRMEAIVRQLAGTAGHPGIAIDSRLGDLELYADPLLERVFSNLLDNAVRHGDHVKTIAVTAVPAESGLVLRWEDDGAGVPDADKERIFERGFGKHTGLGLFLAREILGLTGITIRETGMYGTGARFEMIVPARAYRYVPGRGDERRDLPGTPVPRPQV
jgi:signal transduction histidine kinase